MEPFRLHAQAWDKAETTLELGVAGAKRLHGPDDAFDNFKADWRIPFSNETTEGDIETLASGMGVPAPWPGRLATRWNRDKDDKRAPPDSPADERRNAAATFWNFTFLLLAGYARLRARRRTRMHTHTHTCARARRARPPPRVRWILNRALRAGNASTARSIPTNARAKAGARRAVWARPRSRTRAASTAPVSRRMSPANCERKSTCGTIQRGQRSSATRVRAVPSATLRRKMLA